MELSRDNHYVPQMYLKNWATDNRVWVYNLLVSHENVPVWTQKSIGRIAFQDNLYMRVKNGMETDEVERVFSERFETPAKEAIEKIINRQKMKPSDWKNLSLFAAAQFVRTPAFYHTYRKTMKEITAAALNEVCEKLSSLDEIPKSGTDIPEDGSMIPLSLKKTDISVDEYHSMIEVSVIEGRSTWLMNLKHLLEPDSVLLNAFSQLKWSIVSCPEGRYWPTSDNPVCVFGRDRKGNLIITDGIARGNNMILFPISPEKLLIGKLKNRLDYRIASDMVMYSKLKELIISNALLYVYSDRTDASVPSIRPRIIDESEYKRTQEMYKQWYSSYLEQEIPLIRQWEVKP